MTRGTLATMDDAIRAKLLKMARRDASAPEISAALDVPLWTVQRALKAAGLSAPRGRPATGQRPKIWTTVDEDVVAELEAEAADKAVTPTAVAGTVLTEWARRRVKRRSTKK